MIRRLNLSVAYLGLIVFPGAAASATEVTYTVDPTQSVLTLSGTYLGDPLSTSIYGSTEDPVISDGFVISYAGTITADRDFSADTLTINGGNIVAGNNTYIDNTSPGLPNAPPDRNYLIYGGSMIIEYSGLWSGNSLLGTITGLSLSPSSPVITSPDAFNASEVSIASSGEFYCQVTTADNSPPSTSNEDSPTPSSLALGSEYGSLTDSNGLETLSIPLDTDFTLDAGGNPVSVNLSGDIVATAVIPEPASLSLVGIYSLLLLKRIRR